MKRQDLRRYAFLITFGRSLSFDTPEEALNNYLESFKEDYVKEHGDFSEKDLLFVKDILSGINNNIETIDSIISKYSQSYDIKRISKVALAALRVSIYEILYRDDIPDKVSVNEAIEIVKLYDSEKTKKFVNGVLANLLSENKK